MPRGGKRIPGPGKKLGRPNKPTKPESASNLKREPVPAPVPGYPFDSELIPIAKCTRCKSYMSLKNPGKCKRCSKDEPEEPDEGDADPHPWPAA